MRARFVILRMIGAGVPQWTRRSLCWTAGRVVLFFALALALPDRSPAEEITQTQAVTAAAETPVPQITRGPYVQMATPRTIVIRWRTDIQCNSRVRFGISPGLFNRGAYNTTKTTEHSVRLFELRPNTRYYYAVGTRSQLLFTSPDLTFITSPTASNPQPARIWVIGDAGTGGAGQAAVRDAYDAYTGDTPTDLWLMLGDNAYENGTDAEFQTNVFDMYPRLFGQSVVWPTLGNHDTAESTTPSLTIPYFQIFTLPTRAQAGGRASGTEKYYSFNYSNIHFVCLDSQASDRSTIGRMAKWLRADLRDTNRLWRIAYWHHPPYSGCVNSDSNSVATEMRENINPILEAGGVDLVFAGHSHVYERSYLINGHYGTSDTFVESMKKSASDGRETGGGVYIKPARKTPNAGTVYAVVGSSGKLSNWSSGSSELINPDPHPVMVSSRRQLGSMVLDVNGSRLDARFLSETGTVEDEFTIVKQ